MADIKTILRELSVIIGYVIKQFNLKDDYKIVNNFVNLIKKYCVNINENIGELNKIKDIHKFDSIQLDIIENGIILGGYLYDKLNLKGEIKWIGSEVKNEIPADISVDEIGISLKENSHILKNPAFADYLNALTSPDISFKNVHVFRLFAQKELNDWFKYSFNKLTLESSKYHNGDKIFKYKSYYIKKGEDELIFVGHRKCQKLSLSEEVDEDLFNKSINNDIVEHTFSKWISESLKKDDGYIKLKKQCSEKAGENLRDYIINNKKFNKENILGILQIYNQNYYYGKCINNNPKIFLVPTITEVDIDIKDITVEVPKSQLNVNIIFNIIVISDGKANEIKMHVECRYSHGQFNGIPEAKIYCKDDLNKLFNEL